jgi:CRISPR system Cascade subunit CasC
MFIELHILQNFAPSNLNRDDTGNPKDTEFGGVRRARISSQCIKRAIRLHPAFEKATQVEKALRTRWITRLLVKPLTESNKPEELAWAIAEAFANALKIGTTKDKSSGQPRTTVLLYLSQSEIKEICTRLIEKWDEIAGNLVDGKSPVLDKIAGEIARQFKERTGAPDIALFGRMLAEKPELNIDAACQVAHAISTHRVNMEMDFYTAVDDISTDEETGAGMMGVTAFNSACFYRYARIDWEQLVKNLDNDRALAGKAVEGFLRAAVQAVPTGKQNSFAAQNPPDFILGVSRTDGQSWSLANAFEKPVRPERDGGLTTASIAALDAYWGRLSQAYGNRQMSVAAMALAEDAPISHLKDYAVPDVEAWLEKLLATLPKE